MTKDSESKEAIVEIAKAFAQRPDSSVEDIVALVKGLKSALGFDGVVQAHSGDEKLAILVDSLEVDKPAQVSVPKGLSTVPIIPVEDSFSHDAVRCLICGFSGTMLKRHLRQQHNLEAKDYLNHFGLAKDHPIVAPSYSIKKSETAKRIKFGRKKAAVVD